VYLVSLDPTQGKEMQKTRPAVIIQNDVGNEKSALIIIVPDSSLKGTPKVFPIFVTLKKGESGLGEDSFVHCGQIRAVDKSRFVTKIGHLSQEKMDAVSYALKVSFDLLGED